MIRKFIVGMMCFAAFGMQAQDGTVSPFSFFGIGDSRINGTVENQMMGGLSMYGDSIHLNLLNPAAYSKLRLTVYTGAISRNEFTLKDFTTEEKASVTNVDYLAVGLPLGKGFGAGFGVMPISSVGYNILSESVNANDAAVTNVFSGSGGLNRVFISVGYEILPNLRLGVTVNHDFGTLKSERIQSVENVQFGTIDRRESRVNGFDFNYALNYEQALKKNYTLYSSLIVNTQANLVSDNIQRIGSFSTTTGTDIEVLEVDLERQGLKRSEVKIPTTATLGLGIGIDKKWFVGAEYSFQELNKFNNEFIRVDNVGYNNANSIAVGGFYVPDYTSFTSYYKRVTYRAGFKYSQTGMTINNEEIDNIGITFGLSLPLGGGFSNVNLGFEIGKRGTTDANLIEENYFKLNLGISLNDKWFLKRKIN
ncbi:hypothetical protein U1E44_05805 [Arenibacter sp. GZD96]|uniref:hypothetical protein n=1 Tax=Aurantibrevibacter litoralis TaxID=3106030 RepID=UPI002AFDDDC9|nr:hypothetical protein [Arenibacter sp. GZD-96]MEA1785596.1 hypothetical protein [Arenibacter sp. GZD-96]